jgi:O-antigen/teichoic acid export membrane protein
MNVGQTAWRRWRGPLSIGVLDQGVMSGANLLLNITLARWMVPADYGAFAVAFAFLLVLSGPHSALLIDPLSVVGPRQFAGRYTSYARSLIAMHGLLMVPAALVMAVFFVFMQNVSLLSWFVALTVAMSSVLLLWLVRAICYLEMRPAAALTGSVLYGATLVPLLIWAHVTSRLSAPTAMLLMGVAGAMSGLCIIGLLGLLSTPWSSLEVRRVIHEHWVYGRWILAASVAHGASNGLYVPLVGALVGLEQTAVLRALQNLVLPLEKVLGGVAMVAYPSMAAQVALRGPSYLRRRGFIFLAANGGAAAVYCAAIAGSGAPLLALVYGEGYYGRYASLLWLIAAAAVVSAVAQSLGILVRVINRPQAVLWAKISAAAWLAAAGIFLVRGAGVTGAVLGLAGGSIAEIIALTLALGRVMYLSVEETTTSSGNEPADLYRDVASLETRVNLLNRNSNL